MFVHVLLVHLYTFYDDMSVQTYYTWKNIFDFFFWRGEDKCTKTNIEITSCSNNSYAFCSEYLGCVKMLKLSFSNRKYKYVKHFELNKVTQA